MLTAERPGPRVTPEPLQTAQNRLPIIVARKLVKRLAGSRRDPVLAPETRAEEWWRRMIVPPSGCSRDRLRELVTHDANVAHPKRPQRADDQAGLPILGHTAD